MRVRWWKRAAGTEQGQRVGGTQLWRAQQPLHQPACSQRQRRTEGQVLAQAADWYVQTPFNTLHPVFILVCHVSSHVLLPPSPVHTECLGSLSRCQLTCTPASLETLL